MVKTRKSDVLQSMGTTDYGLAMNLFSLRNKFIGRTDAEAEVPILWPPDVKN